MFYFFSLLNYLGNILSGLKKVEVTAALHTPYLFKQTNPPSNIGHSFSTINLQRILFFFFPRPFDLGTYGYKNTKDSKIMVRIWVHQEDRKIKFRLLLGHQERRKDEKEEPCMDCVVACMTMYALCMHVCMHSHMHSHHDIHGACAVIGTCLPK